MMGDWLSGLEVRCSHCGGWFRTGLAGAWGGGAVYLCIQCRREQEPGDHEDATDNCDRVTDAEMLDPHAAEREARERPDW